MRALLVATGLALAAMAAPAGAGVPELPCPQPVEVQAGDGSAGTHVLVDLGCDGGPVKVCAPTWIGAIDLLMVC